MVNINSPNFEVLEPLAHTQFEHNTDAATGCFV